MPSEAVDESVGEEGGVWRPLVSIIVLSYNQAQYIRQTLDSILSQSYRPLEVLVVDGGSDDGTVAILCEYGERFAELQWRSERDAGPADAVNKGLAWAKGEIAGIQSSDDLYLPGAIATAVDAFRGDSNLGLVYGDATLMDALGVQSAWEVKPLPYTLSRFLCGSTVIIQGSAFFRLELAKALGGWRRRYYVADTDLWLRMAYRTRVLKVDSVLSAWRMHPAQRNTQAAKIWHSYWQMIEESEEIKQSPLRLRLAADAGRRLLVQYYDPGRSAWFRVFQIWRAVLTYPPAIRALRSNTSLVPGIGRLINWVRKVARGKAGVTGNS